MLLSFLSLVVLIDVYKRQLCDSVELGKVLDDVIIVIYKVKNEGMFVIRRADTVKAVSYTHLDVYKRQATRSPVCNPSHSCDG